MTDSLDGLTDYGIHRLFSEVQSRLYGGLSDNIKREFLTLLLPIIDDLALPLDWRQLVNLSDADWKTSIKIRESEKPNCFVVATRHHLQNYGIPIHSEYHIVNAWCREQFDDDTWTSTGFEWCFNRDCDAAIFRVKWC